MNLKELEKFKLSNAVSFNAELNPHLYVDDMMRPNVRLKIIEIAEHFKQFMGIEEFALVDITVSGSNAAYSYTPHSDIDLHLIVDFTQLADNDVYREMFDAKKYQYNDQHDIKIKGYDVEVYVQDSAQPHVSLGNYSVLNDEWNRFPTKQHANVDEESTFFKYNKLKQLAMHALNANSPELLDKVLDVVKRYRRAGLSENGEFGPENLAFKLLRRDGYFEQLWDMKRSHTNMSLSLEAVHDPEETDLEKELTKEFSEFGVQSAEDIIKALYSQSDTLFDDYDYDDLHKLATTVSPLVSEASYSGNLGAIEVMRFYQEAPKHMIDHVSNLIALHKNKEAWEMIQAQQGVELAGKEFHTESESYQPPEIEVGDEVKVGKFKNRKATVKGFDTDKDNQPVLKTTKGDHKLFKPKISKLEDELEEGVGIIVKGVNTTADVGVGQTKIEADKLNLACDADGIPQLLKTNGTTRTVDNIMESKVSNLSALINMIDGYDFDTQSYIAMTPPDLQRAQELKNKIKEYGYTFVHGWGGEYTMVDGERITFRTQLDGRGISWRREV